MSQDEGPQSRHPCLARRVGGRVCLVALCRPVQYCWNDPMAWLLLGSILQFYIFAYCGLVVEFQIHLTANISICAPLPTSTKMVLPSQKIGSSSVCSDCVPMPQVPTGPNLTKARAGYVRNGDPQNGGCAFGFPTPSICQRVPT